jgi:hypothetical protein
MKKLLLISVVLGITACTHKEEAKSIDYYVAHIDEARTVLKDCESRIKTASDLPKVMSEENCSNARLAEERWMNEYTKGAGKTVPRAKRAFSE